MTFQNPSQETIYNYLREAKTIAIVGLSNKPERVSYKIAELLQSQGYQIFPVNPVLAGTEILGETVYSSLQEIPVTIDIVDVFRRSEFLPEVAEDFLAAKGKVFWAQLGLASEEAAEKLQTAGVTDIVMDRCIKIELHQLLATE